MTQASNGPKPEEPQGGGAGGKVGQILKQARNSAHIEVNKICADLRISPQALEALEQGNYHLLPGDPYIRALLGSMSRYLGLDPAGIVKEYNKEIGAAPQAETAVPYTDKAQTYSTAHKQIFIAIVVALFVVLFLLIGRLNRGENVPSAPATGGIPAPAESLAVPGDSTPESKALAPDSGAAPDSTIKDSARVLPGTAPANTTTAPTVPGAPTAPGFPAAPGTPAAPAAPAPASAPAPGAQAPRPADTAGMTVVIIKPLEDSVGVRITRSGKEDVASLLRLGKQLQISHPDTITVFTSKRGAVEVTVGNQTLTPNKKKFRIFKKTVKVP